MNYKWLLILLVFLTSACEGTSSDSGTPGPGNEPGKPSPQGPKDGQPQEPSDAGTDDEPKPDDAAQRPLEPAVLKNPKFDKRLVAKWEARAEEAGIVSTVTFDRYRIMRMEMRQADVPWFVVKIKFETDPSSTPHHLEGEILEVRTSTDSPQASAYGGKIGDRILCSYSIQETAPISLKLACLRAADLNVFPELSEENSSVFMLVGSN